MMDLHDAVCIVCVNQISDLDFEVDHLNRSQTASELVASPSTVTEIGESFCCCDRQEELGTGFSVIGDCICGEEDQGEQKLVDAVIHRMNTTTGYMQMGTSSDMWLQQCTCWQGTEKLSV